MKYWHICTSTSLFEETLGLLSNLSIKTCFTPSSFPLWYTTCRWWRPKPELAHLMASEADMYLSLTNGCRILTRSFFSLFLLGASDRMPPMKLWNCAFVAVWHLETCSPAGRVFTHLQEHCELHRIYREDLVQGFPGYGISFLEAIPWMLEESL